ncbi:hypothetical protein Pla52n_62070 [Stieleria varia]|uniref:Uncharacterized protein n=1 Tax=Stieleria varia TaxID=2528005 RepID=A0A5C6A1B2_9BACT|nr:hypothetical protein Pla52n_62070 [Stieleria varia]
MRHKSLVAIVFVPSDSIVDLIGTHQVHVAVAIQIRSDNQFSACCRVGYAVSRCELAGRCVGYQDLDQMIFDFPIVSEA